MSNSSDSSAQIAERPNYEYQAEGNLDKLTKKTKESPLMVAGLASFFVIAGYGIYSFRNRGKLSASNYLMQLRVTAQGAVIGCLSLGIMKSLYDRFKRSDESEK